MNNHQTFRGQLSGYPLITKPSKESPDEPEILKGKPERPDGKVFRAVIDRPGARLEPDKSTTDSDVGTTGGGKIEGPPRQF